MNVVGKENSSYAQYLVAVLVGAATNFPISFISWILDFHFDNQLLSAAIAAAMVGALAAAVLIVLRKTKKWRATAHKRELLFGLCGFLIGIIVLVAVLSTQPNNSETMANSIQDTTTSSIESNLDSKPPEAPEEQFVLTEITIDSQDSRQIRETNLLISVRSIAFDSSDFTYTPTFVISDISSSEPGKEYTCAVGQSGTFESDGKTYKITVLSAGMFNASFSIIEL